MKLKSGLLVGVEFFSVVAVGTGFSEQNGSGGGGGGGSSSSSSIHTLSSTVSIAEVLMRGD
jgi:hypothetical protein